MSRMENRKKMAQNSGNGKLLKEIEVLSKALSVDKPRLRSAMSTVSSRSKSVEKPRLPEPKSTIREDSKKSVEKDSKKSIWSWKGIKALTSNVRNRRFNCCFSLQVHCIEGLPAFFDDLSLVVYWKRTDDELMTRPVRVIEGTAEFEEQLTHSCSVYGSRSGPHHSAKYEARHFLLYASVYGSSQLDLGKHRVDLTRLLPLTLEELEEERSSGRWTTSFRLSGMAKGATMNVSFGYLVGGNNSPGHTSGRDYPETRRLKQNGAGTLKIRSHYEQNNEPSTIRRAGSLPARSSTSSRSVEDIKDLHEILPVSKSELSQSVDILYQKLDQEKLNDSLDDKSEVVVFSDCVEEPLKMKSNLASNPGAETAENECEVGDFSIIEQGIELSSNKKENSEYDIPKGDQMSTGNNFEFGNIEEVPLKEEIPRLVEETGSYHDEILGSDNHMSIGNNFEFDNAEEVPVKEEIQIPRLLEETDNYQDEILESDHNFKENDLCTKESLIKELESALESVSELANEEIDSQEDECEFSNKDNYLDVKASYRAMKKGKSMSLDDVTNSVASEFLDMLGIDHSPFGLSSESEPESPRERLLRQFEKDNLAEGCSLFNFDLETDQPDFLCDDLTGSGLNLFDDLNHSSGLQVPTDVAKIEVETMENKTGASLLEDLETEALMHEWGLNEKAFQFSPPKCSGGFGSPIEVPLGDPYQLPSLGEGIGPFIQTKNGGFLRSMNPALFRNSKSGGNLIMQVSSPVVVPAEMGSGIMDIMQSLASVGIEKLSIQANKLMPLEDITGKTMQQIAWEAGPTLEGFEGEGLMKREFALEPNVSVEPKRVKGKSSGPRPNKFESSSISLDKDSEYVSLEDLAPLAMDKIEALSIEGLRIQSGMSDEDAPSSISPQSIGEFSALNAGGSLGLEGAGGLQLLDIKDNGGDVDGLMGLSLTLDEWMRLDSGEIDEEDYLSERTSKILAAHHATSIELFHRKFSGEKRRGKSKKCGLLGNNFTVAVMVQLRDPLRNYEPVGTPMLSLIQVERVFIPPKPKIYSTVSELRTENEDDDVAEPGKEDSNGEMKEEKLPDEEHIPQYKITEVHVAGLKSEPGKKKLWGSSTQQQSGSRWLLANGMGKKNKHPLMKSKNAAKPSSAAPSQPTTTVQPGDSLWSISSRVHGTGAKWKELAALNPHTRNPNVIFPNEIIRLR